MKFIFFFFFLLFAQNVHAQIDLDAIKLIESGNQQFAFNKNSGARGLYQITLTCLKDFSQRTGIKYSTSQLFDKDINTSIADWYLNYRIPQLLKSKHKKINVENILISYNCGINCVGKPLPKETKDYIKKYNNLIDKH